MSEEPSGYVYRPSTTSAFTEPPYCNKAGFDELARLREENEKLREALKPFVQHGRAVGAFGGDQGPYRLYTADGYRVIKADDFWKALAALKAANSQAQIEERSDEVSAAGGEVGLTHKTLSDPHQGTVDGRKDIPG